MAKKSFNQFINDGDPTEFEILLGSYENMNSKGLVRQGKILNIDESYVYVDVGDKSDGIITIAEISSGGNIDIASIAIGDSVEVFVGSYDDKLGYLICSREKAKSVYALDDIERACNDNELIKGTVVAKTKGGLIVDLNGVTAFLPGSQIDVKLTRDFDAFLGKVLDLKVISVDKKSCNVIVSRRKVIEDEIKKLKENVLTDIKEGDELEGIVKNITDYGVFVDLGGMDGLIYITDISWKRISHPTEILSLGQKINVKVIKYDEEKRRVSLGYKQLFVDPWQNIMDRHKPGDIVEGVIINITDYGAFVELDDDIEGLIHLSEMSWEKKQIDLKTFLTKGQRVKASILSIEPETRKLSLSLKRLTESPWNLLKDKYPAGKIVEGTVKNIYEFGVSVELEENLEGYVKQNDFSWTKRTKHPHELFKQGEKIKAIVLSIDEEKQRIYLGIKQLTESPWSNIKDKYSVGTVISGTVSNITEFGIFVQLEEGIEGLIHNSKIPENFIKENNISAGSQINAEIIMLDTNEQKVGLSLINVEQNKL
ncbi:MAG: 30S ribosomal protein S1 [bacterium]